MRRAAPARSSRSSRTVSVRRQNGRAQHAASGIAVLSPQAMQQCRSSYNGTHQHAGRTLAHAGARSGAPGLGRQTGGNRHCSERHGPARRSPSPASRARRGTRGTAGRRAQRLRSEPTDQRCAALLLRTAQHIASADGSEAHAAVWPTCLPAVAQCCHLLYGNHARARRSPGVSATVMRSGMTPARAVRFVSADRSEAAPVPTAARTGGHLCDAPLREECRPPFREARPLTLVAVHLCATRR